MWPLTSSNVPDSVVVCYAPFLPALEGYIMPRPNRGVTEIQQNLPCKMKQALHELAFLTTGVFCVDAARWLLIQPPPAAQSKLDKSSTV
jgi:hypothetical protein